MPPLAGDLGPSGRDLAQDEFSFFVFLMFWGAHTPFGPRQWTRLGLGIAGELLSHDSLSRDEDEVAVRVKGKLLDLAAGSTGGCLISR